MSRIVLTTIGSLGDIHPTIAIALELRKRGHDVVFATHKGLKMVFLWLAMRLKNCFDKLLFRCKIITHW